MSKEPEAMREIHLIREKHWKETKDMGMKERIKQINHRAEEFIRKNHLDVKVSLNVK